MASGLAGIHSGILLTESYGPVIGSAAFFNDLARELLAIMLIPWSGAPQPFNGAMRRDINGLYTAGTAPFRRGGDCAGGHRSWLHPQSVVPILMASPLNTYLAVVSCRQFCAKSISCKLYQKYLFSSRARA